MSTTDPAGEPIVQAVTEAEQEVEHEVEHEAADYAVAEPVVVEREVEVGIVRSVRFGRILIGGALIGAALASLAAVFFPIYPEADYSMAQVMGFMLLIGAIIGLALAAVFSLILAAAVKRQSGTAVAIQSDVR